jgi:YfiH family protein
METSQSAIYRQPAIFAPFREQLVAAESTRHGGVSAPPYASLNLGLYTGDDPAAVRENRRRFFAALGFTPEQAAGARQVHGARVHHVEAPGHYEGYDALITDQTGLLLTVTVADCAPVLVFDPRQGAVAAIHAGWRGTAAGIVEKTMRELTNRFGSRPVDCYAYIGTCIDECAYEVDADVADHFPRPHKRWDGDRHKFYLDLKGANRSQLLDAGVPAVQIGLSPYSTVVDNRDYFSHRRENGRTGRSLAAIAMKGSDNAKVYRGV